MKALRGGAAGLVQRDERVGGVGAATEEQVGAEGEVLGGDGRGGEVGADVVEEGHQRMPFEIDEPFDRNF